MKKGFKICSLLVLCFCLFFTLVSCSDIIGEVTRILDENGEDTNNAGTTYTNSNYNVDSIISADLSIHFMTLGEYPGDSILVKVGNTEVLIDAGYSQSSAKTIKDYVDKFCADGILEYVVVTHGDTDHIAGFVGTTSIDGIFESYECQTIIDFARTNLELETAGGNATLYAKYLAERAAEVEKGAKRYSALECWNNLDGAKRTYTLGGEVTMSILYQKFYEMDSSDENNYSVCVLIQDGKNSYLLTGDLEVAGEESLVENNDLPECVLFKAGHHGSPTSSNDVLLSVIKPSIVTIMANAGDDKHGESIPVYFPSQVAIDRIAKYTKQVYIPTCTANFTDESADNYRDDYQLLNGDIVVMSNDKTVSIACSNNDTLLKDTEWFKADRVMPSQWAS